MNNDRVTPGALPSDSALRKEWLDFSLVHGGPLFQLWFRAHLTDDAMMLVVRRMIVISLIAWLPLLILAGVGGTLLGGGVAVPFWKDVDTHVRFLVATPLLIAAELIVHMRLRNIVKTFLDRHLVPESSEAQLRSAAASAYRLRNSVLGEALLLPIVYGLGVTVIWRHLTLLPTATWYGTPSAQGFDLTLAGFWYGYVSLPIFQFLLCRWYFRLLIWARLLWQISRIKLNLVPTHPDGVAGLGFLIAQANAFLPLLVAHGALLSGRLANQIFYARASLKDAKFEILVMAAFMLVLVFGPLLVFTPQLMKTKLAGLAAYGSLAQRYVRAFDNKWIRGGAPEGESLLGSSDIQSLADLAYSHEVVQKMRIFLVSRDSVLQVVGMTLAPLAPLVLTIIPFEELAKKLLGFLV